MKIDELEAVKGDLYIDCCGSFFHSFIDRLVKLFFRSIKCTVVYITAALGELLTPLILREWLSSTDAKALFEIFITFRMVKSTACYVGFANRIGVQEIHLVGFKKPNNIKSKF